MKPLHGEHAAAGGILHPGIDKQVEAAMRQVVISLDEKGFWFAVCPSLPGCVSQGETKEEAIRNIREAIQLYIEVLEEEGMPVPEERFDSMLVVV